MLMLERQSLEMLAAPGITSGGELLNPLVAHVGHVDEALVIDDNAAGESGGWRSIGKSGQVSRFHDTKVELARSAAATPPPGDIGAVSTENLDARVAPIQHVYAASIGGYIKRNGTVKLAHPEPPPAPTVGLSALGTGHPRLPTAERGPSLP